MGYLIIYVIAINIWGFAIMGIDKKRAVNNKWRISERNLFTVALLGGSIGAFSGMKYFRHKTKHTKFIIGIPLIIIVQIVGIVLALWNKIF